MNLGARDPRVTVSNGNGHHQAAPIIPDDMPGWIPLVLVCRCGSQVQLAVVHEAAARVGSKEAVIRALEAAREDLMRA